MMRAQLCVGMTLKLRTTKTAAARPFASWNIVISALIGLVSGRMRRSSGLLPVAQ